MAPRADRTSRMLGIRDALIADNLLAIRAREQHRGATLVFAHNRHLQRHPSTWRFAGMDLEWFSAGAIMASLLGERYVFIAGSLGARTALGLGTPPSDTFEGALQEGTHGHALFDARRLGTALDAEGRDLHARTDVSADQGYFPLDSAALWHCDAILHVAFSAAGQDTVDEAPTAAQLAARIQVLPHP